MINALRGFTVDSSLSSEAMSFLTKGVAPKVLRLSPAALAFAPLTADAQEKPVEAKVKLVKHNLEPVWWSPKSGPVKADLKKELEEDIIKDSEFKDFNYAAIWTPAREKFRTHVLTELVKRVQQLNKGTETKESKNHPMAISHIVAFLKMRLRDPKSKMTAADKKLWYELQEGMAKFAYAPYIKGRKDFYSRTAKVKLEPEEEAIKKQVLAAYRSYDDYHAYLAVYGLDIAHLEFAHPLDILKALQALKLHAKTYKANLRKMTQIEAAQNKIVNEYNRLYGADLSLDDFNQASRVHKAFNFSMRRARLDPARVLELKEHEKKQALDGAKAFIAMFPDYRKEIEYITELIKTGKFPRKHALSPLAKYFEEKLAIEFPLDPKTAVKGLDTKLTQALESLKAIIEAGKLYDQKLNTEEAVLVFRTFLLDVKEPSKEELQIFTQLAKRGDLNLFALQTLSDLSKRYESAKDKDLSAAVKSVRSNYSVLLTRYAVLQGIAKYNKLPGGILEELKDADEIGQFLNKVFAFVIDKRVDMDNVQIVELVSFLERVAAMSDLTAGIKKQLGLIAQQMLAKYKKLGFIERESLSTFTKLQKLEVFNLVKKLGRYSEIATKKFAALDHRPLNADLQLLAKYLDHVKTFNFDNVLKFACNLLENKKVKPKLLLETLKRIEKPLLGAQHIPYKGKKQKRLRNAIAEVEARLATNKALEED